MKVQTNGETVICKHAMSYGHDVGICEYAIAAAVNDTLAEGAEVKSLNIRILAGMDVDKQVLYAMKSAAARCCKKHSLPDPEIELIRTAAVTVVTAQVTALGVAPKEQAWYRETMRAGQSIVLTKWIGLEGTLRILDEKMNELSERFTQVFLNAVRDRREEIFALREIQAAKAESVSAMRQLGDGGIFAALDGLAKEAGTGLVIDMKKISVRQETIEICEYYRLNPYQLASAGSMLLVSNDGEALADALFEEGIEASVIGYFTDNHDKIIRNGEDVRYIDRPAPDEIIKIFEPKNEKRR